MSEFETRTFKDFGAVGDGKTDDADALQAAFDWVNVDDQRRRIGPTPDTYLVSRPIRIK